MTLEQINELSNKIIGFAIKVHKALGPGFVEKVYVKALIFELEKNKIKFTQEKSIKVKYENLLLGQHRLDFLIEDEIILEIKAVYEINNFHMAQMLSYLKAADKKLGLILNFSRSKLEIKRVAYNL
ncbi:MAG: GxxExxY protein [Candidatus Omnitrophota bacterium]